MRITSKLFLLIGLFVVSVAIVGSVAFFMLRSVEQVQTEQRRVGEFATSLRGAQARIASLEQQPIVRQKNVLDEIGTTLDQGLTEVQQLELLPGLSAETQEAFAAIGRLEQLLETNIERLREARENLEGLAEDVFGFAQSIRLRDFYTESQAEAFADQERIDTVTGQYVSATGSVTSRIDTAVTILQEQRDVIAEAVDERLVRVVWIVGGGLALVVLVVLGVAAFIARGIVRTVRLMESRVGELVSGNLAVEVPAGSRDELGVLGGHLRQFVDVVRDAIQTMKSQSAQNVSAKNELVALANETSSSVTEARANTESIGNQMGTLEGQVDQSAQSIQEVNSRLSSLNERIQSQREAAQSSSESAQGMLQSLESMAQLTNQSHGAATDMVQTAEQGQKQFQTMYNLVQELSQYVESVQGMTGSIQDISEQTNLLAMNAAIEAAHAGEQGKGFAVVADEIRNLSQASSKSSREITETLQVMVDRILNASQASTATRDAFAQIDKAVRQVADALEQINGRVSELQNAGNSVLERVNTLRSLAEEIENDSGEIKENTDTLEDGVSAVRRVSAEVYSGMQEISSGMGEISKAMESVSSLSAQLETLSDELDQQVKQFSTE